MEKSVLGNSFCHQVAGHEDQLLLHPKYKDRLIKICNAIERKFYNDLNSDHDEWKPLFRRLMPEFHGSDDNSITIQDLTQSFSKPNVMDIKLGKILYDEFCCEEKRIRMIKVAQETTSGSLGFRICGAKV